MPKSERNTLSYIGLNLAERISLLNSSEKALLKASLYEADKQSHDKEYQQLSCEGVNIKFPLSPQQQQLWFVDQSSLANNRNCLGLQIKIEGHLEYSRLEQAIRLIISKQVILRLYIQNDFGNPKGFIKNHMPFMLAVKDLSNCTLSEAEAIRRESLSLMINRKIDLSVPPLFSTELIKLSNNIHVLHWTVHHIIWDGESHRLFLDLLISAYEGNSISENQQYDRYSKFLEESSESFQVRHANFWKEKLSDLSPTEFVADYRREDAMDHIGKKESYKFDTALTTKLREFAKKNCLTAFPVLMATLYLLVFRFTKNKTPVIGTPVDGRESYDFHNTLGYFSKLTPIKGEVFEDMTFAQLVEQTKQSIAEAISHNDLFFDQIVKAVNPPRDSSRLPLVQVELTTEYKQYGPRKMGECVIEEESIYDGGTRFDISFIVTFAAKGDVDLNIEYNSQLFSSTTIEDLADCYILLLEKCLDNPQYIISELISLSQEESDCLLELGAGANRAISVNSIHELLTQRVKERPEAISIMCGGQNLTYRQLDLDVDILAKALFSIGVRKGDFIGVCLCRTPQLITCLLAIMKIGAAYVPLDSTNPLDRLRLIAADINPKLIIADQHNADKLKNLNASIELITDLYRLNTIHINLDEDVSVKKDDTAYVIFTSGTTGKPKGVVISHGSMLNFVCAINNLYQISCDDRVLAFASIAFDVSVQEIFSPLVAGATIVLANDLVRKEPLPYLEELLINDNVTVAELPPSLMPFLTPVKLKSLRLVSVGGEAFPPELVEDWATVERQFFNGYGPTEATVATVVGELHPDGNRRPAMGLPIQNSRVYVLDEKLNLVPLGASGELCIAGAGLAKGYFGNSSSTSEVFMQNPFAEPGYEIIYKTKDLVRWRTDNRLEYLGRVDEQVQIRGFRVEPSEIEITLCSHENVKQAVCVLRKDFQQQVSLAAFYVSSNGSQLLGSELLPLLQMKLPSYMVPALLKQLNEIPVTASGKVDRKRLESLAENALETNVEECISSDESLEKAIDKLIFQEILYCGQIQVDTNFFDLGGSSLQAMVAVSKLKKATGLEISLATFFASATIRGIASFIRSQGGSIAQMKEKDQLKYLLDNQNFEPSTHSYNVSLPLKLRNVWNRSQEDCENFSANIIVSLELIGKINQEALQKALEKVIEIHPVLKSVIRDAENDLLLSIQNVHPPVMFFSAYVDSLSSDLAISKFIFNESIFKFKLHNPLIRFNLICLDQDEKRHILIVTVHHIIFDGWSIGVFLEDLAKAYNALISSPILNMKASKICNFLNYLSGYNRWKYQGNLVERMDARLESLGDVSMHTILPKHHNELSSTEGLRFPFAINIKQSSELAQIAKGGFTLYMVLLSCLCKSIHSLVGAGTIVVASPVAARNEMTQHSIGFFANVVPVVLALPEVWSDFSMLSHIRMAVLASLDHSDLPIDEYLEALAVTNRKPPYRILFALQDTPPPKEAFQGILINRYRKHMSCSVMPIRNFYTPYEHEIEISLAMEQQDGEIVGLWEFTQTSEYICKNIMNNFYLAVDQIVSMKSLVVEV